MAGRFDREVEIGVPDCDIVGYFDSLLMIIIIILVVVVVALVGGVCVVWQGGLIVRLRSVYLTAPVDYRSYEFTPRTCDLTPLYD